MNSEKKELLESQHTRQAKTIIDLPLLSLGGVSANNLPKTTFKIGEKPLRASSKLSYSPEQHHSANNASFNYDATPVRNRPQSSKEHNHHHHHHNHTNGKILDFKFPIIANAHRNANMTTQPAAPIVLNTKLFSENLSLEDINIHKKETTNETITLLNNSTTLGDISSHHSIKSPVSKIKILPRTTTINNQKVELNSNLNESQQNLNGNSQFMKHNESSQNFLNNNQNSTSEKDLHLNMIYSSEKEALLRELEFKTTVGTGTFGRVMMVKIINKNQYYALKLMSIVDIIKRKQVQHVKNEKAILESIKHAHPFIVELYWTHHDSKHLYLLFEYIAGGELFSHLRQKNRFEPREAVFYACEIVCALEYLHSKSIVYRDLKPENILLDKEGHIKLTDMGFAKICHDKTYTLCGTPEYLAPEVFFIK